MSMSCDGIGALGHQCPELFFRIVKIIYNEHEMNEKYKYFQVQYFYFIILLK